MCIQSQFHKELKFDYIRPTQSGHSSVNKKFLIYDNFPVFKSFSRLFAFSNSNLQTSKLYNLKCLKTVSRLSNLMQNDSKFIMKQSSSVGLVNSPDGIDLLKYENIILIRNQKKCKFFKDMHIFV